MLSKKEISDTTITQIVSSITAFAGSRKPAKFQVLDLIIPKERKVRSIVGGLETSMGMTLWEPLGRILAEKNGFEVLRGKDLLKPKQYPNALTKVLAVIEDDRENQRGKFDGKKTKLNIKKACKGLIRKPIPSDGWEKPPRGHGVDIWLRKNKKDYVFDIKTVQPNVGSYLRFLKQILGWYCYFFCKHPNANQNTEKRDLHRFTTTRSLALRALGFCLISSLLGTRGFRVAKSTIGSLSINNPDSPDVDSLSLAIC